MYRNIAAKVPLFAFDTTTGAAKTGDAANITAYVSKDGGTVTVLADTSAAEMDATNAKGWYLFDVAAGETDAVDLLYTAKSTTSNVSIVGRPIATTPNLFTAFVTPTGAAVNATQFAGQTITAGAGVTLPSSVASPTNITAGTITTVTTVTGLTAADVGAIKTKTDFLPSATAGAAGGVFIAGTNAATSITTALTANVIGNVTGNLSGSVGSVTGTVGSVTGAVGSIATGGIAAASFAAGAIDAAAIATDAIDADALAANAVTEIQAGLATSSALATVQADTDDIQTRLPAALVGGRMDSSVGAMAANTMTAAAAAADLTTELQTGLATSAALATAQTSIDDIPTNAELATALGTADDAVLAQVALVKAVTDKVDTAVELDGAVYRFTTNALEQAPTGGSAPSAAAVADAVWDELLSGHAVSGSTGEALSAAGAAGDPWLTALPGAYGAGTAGKIIGDNIDALISSRTKPADTQAAVTLVATTTNLTNAPTNGDLTATMKASVQTAATAATPTVTAGTVSDKTGYALTSGERTSIAAAVWANVMEGSRTAIQYMRGFGAALLGKASGMATTTATFRDVDDSKDRIVATVDADGNRSAITLDLT